jgi:hypothetical protein
MFVGMEIPFLAKLAHLVISLANIPIGKFGQRIGVQIDEALHGAAGEDNDSVYVSSDIKDIIIRKYAGAFVACVIFEIVLFFIFGGLFLK